MSEMQPVEGRSYPTFRCGHLKIAENSSGHTKRSPRCKTCMSQKAAQRFLENKAAILASGKERRARRAGERTRERLADVTDAARAEGYAKAERDIVAWLRQQPATYKVAALIPERAPIAVVTRWTSPQMLAIAITQGHHRSGGYEA